MTRPCSNRPIGSDAARGGVRQAAHVALMVAALLSIVGQSVAAQAWKTAAGNRGWIGVSFDVVMDRFGRAEYVVITDVSADSPAEDAGVRRGDRVLAINEFDRPDELATLTDRLSLRAGDHVIMDVQRDGRRRRLRLRATPRPDDWVVGSTVELTLQADSMVETWVRAMDSLRVELVAEGAQTVRVRSQSRGPDGERERDERRITVVRGGSSPSVRAPFEFFVFRGEGHDSLRYEMVELNRTVDRLEARIDERQQELRRVVGRTEVVHEDDDRELRQLHRALDETSRRSSALEAAMAEAARQTAGMEYVDLSPSVEVSVPLRRAEEMEFRPLTPYLLGRNRVAGAEVIDLRPELAEYFEVSGGVLVVDVSPGTPAFMAGILPGDVITRLSQVGVRSVEDLRFGVSVAEDSLPVSLIRQGASVQVLLRR